MLFYDAPFKDKKRYREIVSIDSEVDDDQALTRVIFDNSEQKVIIFSEVFCLGHVQTQSIVLSLKAAKQLFPHLSTNFDVEQFPEEK